MILPDDQIVPESEHVFSRVDLPVLLYHIVILSNSNSRVNVEPSLNNYKLLDWLIMSSKSCNLKIIGVRC